MDDHEDRIKTEVGVVQMIFLVATLPLNALGTPSKVLE